MTQTASGNAKVATLKKWKSVFGVRIDTSEIELQGVGSGILTEVQALDACARALYPKHGNYQNPATGEEYYALDWWSMWMRVPQKYHAEALRSIERSGRTDVIGTAPPYGKHVARIDADRAAVIGHTRMISVRLRRAERKISSFAKLVEQYACPAPQSVVRLRSDPFMRIAMELDNGNPVTVTSTISYAALESTKRYLTAITQWGDTLQKIDRSCARAQRETTAFLSQARRMGISELAVHAHLPTRVE